LESESKEEHFAGFQLTQGLDDEKLLLQKPEGPPAKTVTSRSDEEFDRAPPFSRGLSSLEDPSSPADPFWVAAEPSLSEPLNQRRTPPRE
jgi:hypothetical protein